MRVTITVQALFDDGEVAWGYAHEENVVGKVPGADPNELIAAIREGEKVSPDTQQAVDKANRESAAKTLEVLMAELDRARESILSQAASEMIDGDEPPAA